MKKPLEVISEFSKVVGYKINIKKNLPYFFILAINNQKFKFKKHYQ